MGDWIERYLEYAKEQVSPEMFKRWSALAVLGAAMERRVWLTRGDPTLRVYPGQLMVVLVGKSALAKKTTAINMACQFLKQLEPWQIQVLPKKTSPQQLLQDLQRVDELGNPMRYPRGPLQGRRVHSSGFINAGELSVFFSVDAFNETMASLVNDMNDAESGKRSVRFRSWKAELWNPLIGMLGGITPKGIAEELPKVARTAGFFGRILWVYASAPMRGNPMTELMHEDDTLKRELHRDIKQIAEQVGGFIFTQQGKTWFEAWYHDEYHPMICRMDTFGATDSTGYWGRKDGHLLRVAMICTASRSLGTEQAIRVTDLVRAHRWLGEIEVGFAQAMAEIGVGPQAEENQRMLNFIETKGRGKKGQWVPKVAIQRYANSLGMRGYQFDDCLSRLNVAQEIEHRVVGGNQSYWRRCSSMGSLLRLASEETEETWRVQEE